MENDIDFMAYVDETTPPERVFKMLHAARRGYLDSIERYAIMSNENALLKIKLFGRSSEKIKKQKPDLHVFDEAKATPEALNEDTPIVTETPALDAALKAWCVRSLFLDQYKFPLYLCSFHTRCFHVVYLEVGVYFSVFFMEKVPPLAKST